MRQVVTIGVDGSLSGLQHKPGKGLDLRQFGRAEIIRASEIVWDADEQMWFVQILDGIFKGQVLDLYLAMFARLDIENIPGREGCRKGDLAFMFPDYDDAVACEIAFLDALRVKGSYV